MTKNVWTLRTIITITVALLLTSFSALADKKKNFKNALRAGGCGIIPYSREKGQCTSKQQRVNKYCKKRPSSCNDVKITDKNAKRKINERISNIRECIRYRKEVARVFSDVKRKLEREPNKDIKPLAKDLIRKIKDGERGHEGQIRDFENAKRDCERKR